MRNIWEFLLILLSNTTLFMQVHNKRRSRSLLAKMEPSPPKVSRTFKKFNRPFYEPTRKTSAEIVSEARSAVRSLETKRPFTPSETSRTLFSGSGNQEGRPSSAYNIASSYLDSRPPSGKKLSPIDSSDENKEPEDKYYVLPSHYRIPKSLDINNNGKETYSERDISAPDSPKRLDYRVSNEKTLANEIKNLRVSSGPKERTTQSSSPIKKRSNSSGDIRIMKINSSKIICKENKNGIYFKENVKPLLKQMELNHLHGDEDALIVNFDVLWKTLEVGNMLGKSNLGTKRRSEILSSVYKCTSGNNVILLLKLSRLFLTLEVSGKNLEAICKLLLKVSRNKKHDKLFVTEGLLSLLLRLIKYPHNLAMADCLVYLTGIIKFLSMNCVILSEMIKYDPLDSISSLLNFTIEASTSDDNLKKESSHMLVQLTSVLVNLASIDDLKERFISYGILNKVLDLTKIHFSDSDYAMNVARLFSKLTMDQRICNEISQSSSNYGILFDVLKSNYSKSLIAVRICYVLGNIAHYCSASREHLLFEFNGIELILEIGHYYIKYLLDASENTVTNIEDVLVKIIRIIANLSMGEKCGIALSDHEGCINTLLQIIDISNSKGLSDELLISCAATLNNLSYFAATDCFLMKNQERFALGMVDMILSESNECIIEAMRVLGNFTQVKLVRDILVKKELFNVIMNLLDTDNSDAIFCTCGVLVNVMLDHSSRCHLKDCGGIPKLINVLKEFAESDWSLAGLVCQVLWNYSEKIDTSTNYFGLSETDDLITLLNELLEPELSLDYEHRSDICDDTIEILKETWCTQFQPVASQLIRRIEMYHSNLVPILSIPPD